MEKKKILVTGFPHTGTSILKSKMGECHNLYEHPYEYHLVNQDIQNSSGDKEFILVKYPQLPIEIRANHLLYVTKETLYKDYFIILTLRNPWYLFTSIIKAGYNPLKKCETHLDPEYHITVGEYLAAAKIFLEAKNNSHLYPTVFSIKYEEFFEMNGEKIKNIFNKIGLNYDDDIFNKRTKNYIHWPNEKFEKIDETNISYQKNKFEYRTWQINQPFQNMNDEVNIPDELSNILENSPIIKELGYTDPRK